MRRIPQTTSYIPDYVKPGDAVKARCHHLRDGSNSCLPGFLKAKVGTLKDWDGNHAPAPADVLDSVRVSRQKTVSETAEARYRRVKPDKLVQ